VKESDNMEITRELRKWIDGSGTDGDRNVYSWQRRELLRLADEIDGMFDRTCAQQEAALQNTIDQLAEARGFADRVGEAVNNGEDVTLFGVDYTPSTDFDNPTIELYNRTIRRMLGEVKHLRDVMLERANSESNKALRAELYKVESERDEIISQLRKLTGDIYDARDSAEERRS
jgi:hypothetical protein